MGNLSLLHGIFPAQGLNPGLLHCRQILYQLIHKRSPRITGVGSLTLLQGIFPTQESKLEFPALQAELSGKSTNTYTLLYFIITTKSRIWQYHYPHSGHTVMQLQKPRSLSRITRKIGQLSNISLIQLHDFSGELFIRNYSFLLYPVV